MSYWEKLSHLRVYSQERRRERYKICFLWKLTQGLVEGYSIKWQWSDRRGRLAIPNNIPRAAPTKVKQARERSLGVHGPHLFNLLPINLRNEDSGDFALFKNHLDIFLSVIPDQPTTPGLARAAESNSLLDQVPLVPDLGWYCPICYFDMTVFHDFNQPYFVCLTTIVETALYFTKTLKYR